MNRPITDEQPRTRVLLPEDEHAPRPRPSHRRSGLLALAIIVFFAVGLTYANRYGGATGAVSPATGSAEDSADGSAAAGTPATPITGVIPTGGTRAGVPVGYAHDRAGAESAAANYVTTYGSEAMVKPASRRAIVDAIADPAVKSSLQRDLDQVFTAMLPGLGLDKGGNPPKGQSFVYRTIPIGTKTVKYSPWEATVEVWNVGVIGLAGKESTKPVTEWWNTTTVVLRWVDHDWKLADVSQREGPTPVNGSQPVSSPEEMKRAVDQFGGLRYGR
ncbi:hypothetical protein C3Y87_18085 [Carbonactinospora thermoautotrophica]|uniref:hypothetical protein n=1 Tax=Carbonactinospora thermoautotrophica TaxID=1469144 RepID=UPI00226EBF1D|nr:hypothetical protein [Carbonactinospora thermoautotrophica]MCX9193277.1 hypothetical protein [Carbonactinospora thermoautotrophica]